MILRARCRKHEWEKHGTCAMVLPALGNELRYFKEGLNLRATFDLVTYVLPYACHIGVLDIVAM